MGLANNNQPIEVTTSQQIHIDTNAGIRSSRFDDIYFLPGHGAEEAEHVFFNGNNLEQRWQELLHNCTANPASTSNNSRHFIIAELGFGTGLNFLVTVHQWSKIFNALSIDKQPTLYFYSFERYPLTPHALEKVFNAYNPYPDFSAQLLTLYPDPIGNNYLLSFTIGRCKIQLILFFGDCQKSLNNLEYYPTVNSQSFIVDAWFLDGFNPKVNSDMWTTQLCQTIAQYSSKDTTTLATFTVAREVKDAINNAGFTLFKSCGYGKKREMLGAVFSDCKLATIEPKNSNVKRTQSNTTLSPCYYRYNDISNNNSNTIQKHALIIGAGIAGCCTAAKLAQRGWRVTVVDAENQPAQAASGNEAAVLFARTAKQRSTLSDFHEASFHYALGYYRSLNNKSLLTGLTGMLKLGEQLPTLITSNPELKSRRLIDKEQTHSIAGIELREGGILYPDAGYLCPAELCRHLLNDKLITFMGNTQVKTLQSTTQNNNTVWNAIYEKNKSSKDSTFHADAVVLCAGHLTHKISNASWLPIKPIRGQTTHLPVSNNSQKLQMTICDKGYVTPAFNNIHATGATFNLNIHTNDLCADDHIKNVSNLRNCLTNSTAWSKQLNTILSKESFNLSGKVGFRATSPDYLPIVGPISVKADFLQQFADLKFNAKQTPAQNAKLTSGLYINTAYGSHGFTCSPLASELLTAQICNEPIPLSDKLRQAITPNRFLVRELIRKN